MDKSFYAMISRLRLITRWSLMRNTSHENVMEHSYLVAVMAHALVMIRNKYFALDRVPLAAEDVLAYALYHDVTEILTGDMPTPIKYQTEDLRQAYAVVEEGAARRLLSMLPSDFRAEYQDFLKPALETEKQRELQRLVKAADVLCAYLKCLEETGRGNLEFLQAQEQSKQKMQAMHLPELEYFLQYFGPSFTLSLDQLQQHG